MSLNSGWDKHSADFEVAEFKCAVQFNGFSTLPFSLRDGDRKPMRGSKALMGLVQEKTMGIGIVPLSEFRPMIPECAAIYLVAQAMFVGPFGQANLLGQGPV